MYNYPEIVVLSEHRERAELDQSLVAFNKHNRFARGEMDSLEIRAYTVDPAKIRLFSREVELRKLSGFSNPLQAVTPRRRLAFAVNIGTERPLHFLTVDPTYTSSSDSSSKLRLISQIWKGKFKPSSGQNFSAEIIGLFKVLPFWPLVIRQTGGQIIEMGWTYNAEKEEFDLPITIEPIYEIIQIGWATAELDAYLTKWSRHE